MEKRGSTTVSDIRQLIKMSSEEDAAIVLSCDSIKKGSIIVVASGAAAIKLNKILEEADEFDATLNR